MPSELTEPSHFDLDLLEAAPDSESSEKAFATTMLRSSKFKSLRFFGLFAVTTVFLGAAVLGVLVCTGGAKITVQVGQRKRGTPTGANRILVQLGHRMRCGNC